MCNGPFGHTKAKGAATRGGVTMPGESNNHTKHSNGGYEPGRNIVLFSDGTGNSSAKLSKTNVWRMFEGLDKSGQSDGSRPVQFAIYDNGVGTSNFRPLMLLGGAFGFGLKRNVLELYEFLCTHYTEDSEIYLVGFSRGAFTMRMLAALIGTKGILQIGYGKDELGRQQVKPDMVKTYARAAYRDFRYSEFGEGYNIFVTVFRYLNQLRARLWFKYNGWDELEYVSRQIPFRPKSHDEKRPVGTCDIRFMGLFDTVSAYGGPIRELTKAWSWLFWPMEPRDWNIGSTVRKVCHAVAIDDPRDTFTPLLISEKATNKKQLGNENGRNNHEDRIEQVWFVGAHSNVGGGYPNDGLSRIPLNWMLDCAEDNGLHFTDQLRAIYRQSVDCCAPLYDPRRGLGGFYRYRPRSMQALTALNPQVKVTVPKVHATVFDRMRNIPTYAPVSIDRDVELVGEGHSLLVNEENIKEGAAEAGELSQRLNTLRGMVPSTEDGAPPQQVSTSKFSGNPFIESAWDKIWWKRVSYFVTFFLGTLILLFPLLQNWGWLRPYAEADSCADGPFCLLRPVLGKAFDLLPGFLEPFEKAFQANIALFTILAAIWAGLIIVGRSQKRSINKHLSQFWQWVLGRETAPQLPRVGAVRKFRTSNAYHTFFERTRNYILPAIFTAVLTIATGYAIGWLFRYLFL